jgi:autotransporter-associated beta strand protein/T5SS/PEP-CTERM-associated repeat protein
MKSNPTRTGAKTLVAVALTLANLSALALDRNWSGGPASYTNAANWTGGVVPGTADLAINNNGTNNAVQINAGNPDWAVGAIQAGGAGSGAFQQNGQTVSVQPGVRTIRLGTAAADTGVYTLNNGTLFFTNGMFAVGEIGTGILNVNGGSLIGNSTLAINVGDSMATANATMDGGFEKTGHTWFAQGFYTPDPTIGLPPEGTTIVAVSNATHSFTMAPSYTANNTVVVYSNSTSATITLSAPAAYSALSFMGSAGNTPGGAMVVGYTVVHADTTTETGTLTIQDWFPTSKTNLVIEARGRVEASGTGVQIIADNPSLLFHDVTLTNTTSPVTSIQLSHISGQGVTCIAAVSGSTGGNFDPVAFTGYNADMIVEPVSQVDPSITSVLNQTAGSITLNSEMWIGNVGNGVYNLSGGTNSVGNWFAVGRSGGDGVINMTGGELNKVGGGNFLIGTGYQSPIGGTPSGTINQSGGTINSTSGEFLVPENSPATGTYNMSGTAVLNVNNWVAFGRGGGAGLLNLTNGLINKTGGGNFIIGAGGLGEFNQYGGTLSNTTSQTWIGEGFQATWNMNGGLAALGLLRIAHGAGAASYVNLNGGEIITSEISANTGSYSELNLNGGTIRASGANANFLHDVLFVNLAAGGVTIDSQAFDITVPQNLTDNGGGLTKTGSGTLTLTGAAAYSGPTVVNAGRLAISTTSGGGSYTLADGTRYSLDVLALNAQVPMTSLTMGTSTGVTLDFNMGLHGVNTAAPVAVSGAVTANGAITVNIPTGAFTIGSIPLISYVSSAGTATFVTGTLPVGVAGYVTNNTTASRIELVVTAAAAPRWDGTVNGNWDINATANWVDLATASPTVFQNGNPVVFNDQAAGTTDVNVVQDVQVNSILVTNSSLTYSITGTKAIGGTAGLTKQGSMPLTIGNTNTYTGATMIQNGTLTVSNLANGGLPSAIGASSASAANLVIDNGTLSYAGPTVAVNRGFSVTGTNSTINTVGNLTLSGPVAAGAGGRFQKSGAALLTYAGSGSNLLSGAVNPGLHVLEGPMLISGTGAGQTNRVQNDLWIGGTPATGAAMTLTNTALLVDGWIGLGRGNGTVGNVSTLALNNATLRPANFSAGFDNGIAGNSATQAVTLNGTSLVYNNGTFNLAESVGSYATLTLNDSSVWTNRGDANLTGNGGNRGAVVNINGNSVFGSNNRVEIGRGGSTGTVTVANSGKLLVNAWFSVGNGNAGNGTLIAKDSATVYCNDLNITDTGTSIGSMTVQDNALVNGGTVFIGKAGGTVANATISGGTLNSRGNFILGNSANSRGTVNQSGGNVTISGELWLGQSGATGVWNQVSGSVISTNWIAIGRQGSSRGTYTISGGSLAELDTADRFLVGSGGAGTLNISGTAQVLARGDMQLAEGGSGSGLVNLDGGTLIVRRVYRGGGPGTFNFNGGTLLASNVVNSDFFSGLTAANVLSGGAIINSGANTININQALLDGTGGGGLTKLGAGTLYLNGVNTYTGATLVNAGTLGGTGTIAGSVTVASGATFAPGTSIGTLTVGGAVSLAAGSTSILEISKNEGTNDLVTGATSIAYGGTLVLKNLGGVLAVNDTFKLFNATSYSGSFSAVVSQVYGQTVTWDLSNLTVNGTVRVASAVAAPVTLTPVVGGGLINLTWPVDQIGYRLEVQTNALSVGLSSTWSTWPNSAATNQVAIPVNPANPTVFFRLVYP